MYRRLNITLPEETVRLMDQVAKRGRRSQLIDKAVNHYAESVGRANLRKRLKEGAIRRGSRDLRLAEEWFSLPEEAWHRSRK